MTSGAIATPVPFAPRGWSRWLDSMPHPALACEIAPGHVAVARGWHAALEPLPEGAVAPSPVETNLPDPLAVRARLQAALNRIGAKGPEVALLLPDQVIRVFLLHFETFPRRTEEAIPLLRWRLKKSVPFEMEETIVSYMPQPLAPSQNLGVSILAAVAREKVVRQYEELTEALELRPGVVMSSTLAALRLIADERPVLLVRLSGQTLTSVIVRGEALCVYRCTAVPAGSDRIEPAAVLEELYPAVAYFQDTWRENVSEVRLAGFGGRFEEFRRTIEQELGSRTYALLGSSTPGMPAEARQITEKQLDALAGWAQGGSA